MRHKPIILHHIPAVATCKTVTIKTTLDVPLLQWEATAFMGYAKGHYSQLWLSFVVACPYAINANPLATVGAKGALKLPHSKHPHAPIVTVQVDKLHLYKYNPTLWAVQKLEGKFIIMELNR